MNTFEEFPWKVRCFEQNLEGNDYVVGDIHGQFHLLDKLLLETGFNTSKDRLFCLGDLIDRGSLSHLFTQYLSYPWLFSSVGNHEAMLLKYGADALSAVSTWYPNGGWWWEHMDDNYREQAKVAVRNSMYSAISIAAGDRRYGLVHTDVPLGVKWGQLCSELSTNATYQATVLWSRLRIQKRIEEKVEGVDLVFCGHTPVEEPFRLGNVLFIDTGSGHQPSPWIPKPTLTAVKLSEKLQYYSA